MVRLSRRHLKCRCIKGVCLFKTEGKNTLSSLSLNFIASAGEYINLNILSNRNYGCQDSRSVNSHQSPPVKLQHHSTGMCAEDSEYCTRPFPLQHAGPGCGRWTAQWARLCRWLWSGSALYPAGVPADPIHPFRSPVVLPAIEDTDMECFLLLYHSIKQNRFGFNNRFESNTIDMAIKKRFIASKTNLIKMRNRNFCLRFQKFY